jgi:hypothetical protein
MKNIYRVILVICFFVVALLSCYWWTSRESLFTDEFVLRKIFGNYNTQCDCAEVKGVTSYYKSYEKQKYGELVYFKEPAGSRREREDLNRHQVALISNLEDGTKLVVTSSKSFHEDTGEFLDCDGCGSWLSIGVFEKINSKWTLINKAVNLYGDGAMGKPPEIYANNKGVKDWFEIVVAHSYFLHGEDDEAKVNLVYRKGAWTSVNLIEKP